MTFYSQSSSTHTNDVDRYAQRHQVSAEGEIFKIHPEVSQPKGYSHDAWAGSQDLCQSHIQADDESVYDGASTASSMQSSVFSTASANESGYDSDETFIDVSGNRVQSSNPGHMQSPCLNMQSLSLNTEQLYTVTESPLQPPLQAYQLPEMQSQFPIQDPQRTPRSICASSLEDISDWTLLDEIIQEVPFANSQPQRWNGDRTFTREATVSSMDLGPQQCGYSTVRYSCPMARHNPARYQQVPGQCTHASGIRWSDMFEHIERHHSARDSCRFCGLAWTKDEDWEAQLVEHLKLGLCRPPEERKYFPEMMTAEQERNISCEIDEHLSPDEAWMTIWLRLFGTFPIPNPRMDEPP